MIRAFFQFFQREKIYAFLLLFIVVAYTYAGMVSKKEEQEDRHASTLSKFQEAEQKFQQKIKSQGPLQAFENEDSGLLLALKLFSALIFGLFCVGLVLDFLLLSSPSFRAKWIEPPQVIGKGLKLAMFFKVAILFLFTSLALSLLLGLLKKFFFQDMTQNFMILSHTIVGDSACIFYILKIYGLPSESLKELGVRTPRKGVGYEFLLGWGGYAAVLPVFVLCLILVVMVARFFSYEPDPHPLVAVFLEEERSGPMIFYSLALAAVIGPLIEEIFFRGFCYQVFRNRFGVKVGMVLSASLFAVIHANTFAFWPIFILGAALALLFEVRHSLIASIVLHITHNTIFITYFFLMKSLIGSHATQ